ncbi:MAG: hypothetical protein FRX49_07337 [Trebouxia sp. A1-2]|nr:MAG: hypothetical protein FRX49_07337 [Trebouxia sp. A1-2]
MDGRLVRDDVDQIKAEMRGQPMQGPRPTNEELKRWGLTCVEQYHIYDTYWCWVLDEGVERVSQGAQEVAGARLHQGQDKCLHQPLALLSHAIRLGFPHLKALNCPLEQAGHCPTGQGQGRGNEDALISQGREKHTEREVQLQKCRSNMQLAPNASSGLASLILKQGPTTQQVSKIAWQSDAWPLNKSVQQKVVPKDKQDESSAMTQARTEEKSTPYEQSLNQ